MMETLVQLLYTITTYLLVPVVLGLLILLAWSLLELGGFLRERWVRRKGLLPWTRFEQGLREGRECGSAFFELPRLPGFLGLFQQKGLALARRSLFAEKICDDFEIASEGRLGRMKLGIRIGPMFGLMGTLIPMGPALMGLSQGNMEEMAQNLVVAFSTTVLGLLVGGICYTIAISRRRWYAQDLVAIDFLRHCLEEES